MTSAERKAGKKQRIQKLLKGLGAVKPDSSKTIDKAIAAVQR